MNYTSSITEKGQVTIPVSLRRKFGLNGGDQAGFRVNRAGELVIGKPKTLQEVRDLLRAPTKADPLTEREKLIVTELAKQHGAS
jgi:AbrB family looped-hinge helix DNA binding protein